MANAKEIGKYVDDNLSEKEGSINMCEALEAIREEGKESGKEIGKELGENLFAELTGRLLEKNRMDDLLRAAKDKGYRKLLYEEYGIN